jgi:CubicO group peptidase (beta-lactamase class C family)
MDDLERAVDRVAAETGFSGVVRVDHGDSVVLAKAYGLAHRASGRANTVDTQFGTASATKGLTALTIIALVVEGRLALDTTARSVLGDDLPLIAGDVTVEQLLAHRSGIGDYFDEDLEQPIDEYVLAVPPNELATTEDYLRVLDGYEPKFAAGSAFSYCNGGYVVLALIAERVAGVSFYELVARDVCARAGMRDTAFLRSDELPARAATGYLYDESDRTNVFHLAVRGSGDGGIYSTVGDVHSLWAALFAGSIVPPEWVAEMTRPRSDVPDEKMRYGLGFWLHETRDVAVLVGYDAGVSFRSAHDARGAFTHTVISNTSEGAWPIARLLDELHSA